MPDRKASSTSNSSRTAAKIAVVVLIVIAIAGFVLAGLKGRQAAPEPAAAADPTQQGAVAPTAAAPAAPASAAEAAVPAHIVAFAPASASLPEKELAKVRTMADAAKKKNREVQIVSTVEVAQFGLAQQRATLVRQTLEQGGVPLARMSIKLSTVPQGTVSASEANRVEMVLR